MAAVLKYKKTLLAVLVLAIACVLSLLVGTHTEVARTPMPRYAKDALELGVGFELLSLDPLPLQKPGKDDFRGFRVLGKTTITDGASRDRLVLAFKKAVDESHGVAGCFKPRHGIRVLHEGKPVEFVICFECLRACVHVGDKQDMLWIADTPQELFNQILKEAQVPLPDH